MVHLDEASREAIKNWKEELESVHYPSAYDYPADYNSNDDPDRAGDGGGDGHASDIDDDEV